MVKIRRGVFETNSSSSHSIVMMNRAVSIKEKSYAASGSIDRDGVLNMYGCPEFGRNFRVYTSWIDKFAYCCASFGEKKIDELCETVKANRPEVKEIHFAKDYGGETDYGYVDHQSSFLLHDAIQQLGITAEQFIFDPHIILICDGDELHIFDSLKRAGIVDMDNVKSIINPTGTVRY